tara:strand:- start:2042 stop:2500 length:459 start_codon:yes stop_codon:yes gene_type:complete
MIQQIKDSAEAVGVIAFITNSTEKIETQLDSLTKDSDEPIMLISWDIVTDLEFDENGFLKNPASSITALLLEKAYDNTKAEYERSAERMAEVFKKFIQDLYTRLIKFQKTNEPTITAANYQLVPKYGLGKHSGVLSKWKMSSEVSKISNCNS